MLVSHINICFHLWFDIKEHCLLRNILIVFSSEDHAQFVYQQLATRLLQTLFSSCIQFCKSVVLWNPEFPKFYARAVQTRKDHSLGGGAYLCKAKSKKLRVQKRGSHALAKAQTNLDFILRPLLGGDPLLRSPLFPNSLSTRNKHLKTIFTNFRQNRQEKKKINRDKEPWRSFSGPFCSQIYRQKSPV